MGWPAARQKSHRAPVALILPNSRRPPDPKPSSSHVPCGSPSGAQVHADTGCSLICISSRSSLLPQTPSVRTTNNPQGSSASFLASVPLPPALNREQTSKANLFYSSQEGKAGQVRVLRRIIKWYVPTICLGRLLQSILNREGFLDQWAG